MADTKQQAQRLKDSYWLIAVTWCAYCNMMAALIRHEILKGGQDFKFWGGNIISMVRLKIETLRLMSSNMYHKLINSIMITCIKMRFKHFVYVFQNVNINTIFANFRFLLTKKLGGHQIRKKNLLEQGISNPWENPLCQKGT